MLYVCLVSQQIQYEFDLPQYRLPPNPTPTKNVHVERLKLEKALISAFALCTSLYCVLLMHQWFVKISCIEYGISIVNGFLNASNNSVCEM